MHLKIDPQNVWCKNCLIERRNSSIIIVEDFSISLSIMNGIIREKINNEMENFHNTTNELHQIDIYGILHVTAVEYVFFSNAHWLFSRRDHMLDHNNKFKTIEIIQNMFSNLNGWNWISITRIFFLKLTNMCILTTYS